MKNIKKRLVVPALAVGAFAATQVVNTLSANADKKEPKSTVTPGQLERMRGPRPPSGATLVGTEAHPAVGDVTLPIENAQVYRFTVKTQSGATVPVKWSYSPNQGTFLWATAPIECEDGNTIARGSFVMKIRDDGSGAYALGTKQCPMARIYGCNFNAQQQDTACGACAWDGTDLACTSAD